MGITSIAQLKQARQAQSDSLREKLTQKNNYSTAKDERFWRPKVGDDGTAYAVIRFLPPPQGEEDFYVTIYQYSIKGPGGWYIEKSLQTIGQSDPMNEFSRGLWEDKDQMSEGDKTYARQFNRRQTFVSNIQVLEDPGQEENEGGVFLFGYGAQIMDKIKEKENPEFKDTVRINPFDYWEGANFKLKIRQKDKFPNYEKSEFESPSELYDGDEEKLTALWAKQYSLQGLLDPTDPKNDYKTYDQLVVRMNKALKLDNSKDEDSPQERTRNRPTQAAEGDETPPWNEGDESETESVRATTERGSRRRRGSAARTDDNGDEDESIGFVRNLANGK